MEIINPDSNHLSTFLPSNIMLSSGRIFFEVSKRGCGNGCRYCYNPDSHEDQVLLDAIELRNSLTAFSVLPNSLFGRKGNIISFCPNTEPFMSTSSSELVYNAIDYFLNYRNHLQLSTKGEIPIGILELIKSKRHYYGQVLFFVSISCISGSSYLEPNAISVFKRLENISKCADFGIPCCLYIKPVLKETVDDAEVILNILTKYSPKYVCVGVHYPKRQSLAHGNLRHPAHPELASDGNMENIISLTNVLYNFRQCKLFHSSVCVSSYLRDWFPTPNIWSRYPDLCTNCRPCCYEYEGHPK